MKEVSLKSNEFWYDDKVTTNLDMSSGKHIRFTAVDNDYDLIVENPNGKNSNFPVPKDNTYHAFEISGSKGATYKFTIDQSGPGGTVPQMIVRVN
jgi:hypothetical protein